MNYTRKEVLTAAEKAVSTFRQSTYGGPEQSFRRIADFWSVYLSELDGKRLQPHDVSALMILMKVARLQQDPTHFDSIVDIAGYAACWGETVPKPKSLRPDLIGRINSYASWSTHTPKDDPYANPRWKEQYDF